MIRLLVRFAGWLDRRFPPKITVSVAWADEVGKTFQNHNGRISAVADMGYAHAKRIVDIEKSIMAIKDVLAKGEATAIRPESEKLRDAFVRGEYVRGPSREVIEAQG